MEMGQKKMFKTKYVKSVKFSRLACSSIDVHLSDMPNPIFLFKDIIEHTAKKLSARELEEVIQILMIEKETMLRQCNFPVIYDEMLSDLINVQRERYSIKKEEARKLGFSVSLEKLEEILGEYYNVKDAHAYSIDVGETRSLAKRIDLVSDYSYLALSFQEGAENASYESIKKVEAKNKNGR